MNVFLEELNKVNNGQKMVIIMDGAGWHKSEKLIIPNDIRTIILPPYSPELNPTEKLWQYIKYHTIKNRIYKTLRELENAVCKFIRTLTPEIIRSVCGVNYV
jgi:transposase